MGGALFAIDTRGQTQHDRSEGRRNSATVYGILMV
jgi:hypothetical protein